MSGKYLLSTDSKILLWLQVWYEMNHNIRKRTLVNMSPLKIQISLRIRAVWSESSIGAF